MLETFTITAVFLVLVLVMLMVGIDLWNSAYQVRQLRYEIAMLKYQLAQSEDLRELLVGDLDALVAAQDEPRRWEEWLEERYENEEGM